jgi:hypothetical protein
LLFAFAVIIAVVIQNSRVDLVAGKDDRMNNKEAL